MDEQKNLVVCPIPHGRFVEVFYQVGIVQQFIAADAPPQEVALPRPPGKSQVPGDRAIPSR
jgi:hypothetical protein